MKSRIYIFILVIAVVFLGACSQDKGSELVERIRKINEEETYPETPGELEIKYDNIDNIISDADNIVKIKVLEQSIEMLDGYPQTNTVAEVDYVSKGALNIGDKIVIVEEGGNGEEVLGGIPVLKDKSEYVLFLTEYNDKYYIVGAFQGRFIEREGHLFQQATSDVKLTKYTPIETEEFLKMIKEKLE